MGNSFVNKILGKKCFFSNGDHLLFFVGFVNKILEKFFYYLLEGGPIYFPFSCAKKILEKNFWEICKGGPYFLRLEV